MQGEILLNKSMEELISFFLILNLPMKELRKSAAQKMKFSIKDIFSKCDQILRNLRIWSHLLKKSLMENFFLCSALMENFLFCAVNHFSCAHWKAMICGQCFYIICPIFVIKDNYLFVLFPNFLTTENKLIRRRAK